MIRRCALALLAPLALVLPSPVARANTYQFINVVDTTTLAPNGIGTFTGFRSPAISHNTVAFLGDYVNGGGIFTSSGAGLTTIVKKGDPGPTGPFSDFGRPSISNDSVAFHGVIRDIHQSSGIFEGSGGPLATIAYDGGAAPQGSFWAFWDPRIDDDTIAFRAPYVAPPATIREGIFVSEAGALSLVASVGDATPLGQIQYFREPAVGNEAVVFFALLHNLDTGDEVQAIFASSHGSLEPVVKTGDPAPIGTFISVGTDVAIGGGALAFLPGYTDGTQSEGAIVRLAGDGTQAVIARFGDPAPIGTFYDLRGIETDGNHVAFFGSYAEQDVNGVFGEGGSGIFVGSGGPLANVIKSGDPLFGSTLLEFQPSRFGGAQPGAIDSQGSGSVAFGYALADGRRGIALAVIVPEPRSAILSATALVFSCLIRHPRTRFSPARFAHSSGPLRKL